MTTRICTLGHSIGALQQLDRLLSPKEMARLLKTPADRDYVETGMKGAIQQLQWMAANETAIRAAMASLKAAEKGART